VSLEYVKFSAEPSFYDTLSVGVFDPSSFRIKSLKSPAQTYPV